MDNVGAIILAGGLSRRMGSHNKLLLPIDGVPMIRQMVTTYLAAANGEVCVVTGFEAPRIRAALSALPVRFIHNAAFEQGQPFSVQAGLRTAPTCDHLLVGLGDQPHLMADDLRALIAAHLCANSAKISIPYHNGTRGNPIIIPSAMHAELLVDNANPGCGKFTRTHPSLVQHIPLSQPGFYSDIDTVDDAAAFAHALSERVAS